MSSVQDLTIDRFAEVFSTGPKWYDLGIFLGVSTADLDSVAQNYRDHGNRRCLIELYKCAEKEKRLSWKRIVTALRRMKENCIADEVDLRQKFLWSQHTPECDTEDDGESANQPQQYLCENYESTDETSPNPSKVSFDVHETANGDSEYRNVPVLKSPIPVDPRVSQMFLKVTRKFTDLTVTVQRALKKSRIPLEELQHVIAQMCHLDPLSGDEATFDKALIRLSSHYCFLRFDILESLVQALLSKNKPLQKEMTRYRELLDEFKTLAEMRHLAHLIKTREIEGKKRASLKLREFWSQITVNKFERAMRNILKVLYECGTHIAVEEGCICVSWFIPDFPTSNLFELEPEDKTFFKVIGLVSLQMGDSVVYDKTGEGCETMEAAMLQAIKLKDARAIEVLLLLGCDPEVVTFNEGIGLTSIINIRNRNQMRVSVEYICIFDQDQHTEVNLDANDHHVAPMATEQYLCKLIDTSQAALTRTENIPTSPGIADDIEPEEVSIATSPKLGQSLSQTQTSASMKEDAHGTDIPTELPMTDFQSQLEAERKEKIKIATELEQTKKELIAEREMKRKMIMQLEQMKDHFQSQLEAEMKKIKIATQLEQTNFQSQLEAERKEKIKIATELKQTKTKLQGVEEEFKLLKASLNRELLIAASIGKKEEVIVLIISGADIECNEIDKDQRTALHSASKGGYSEVVEELLTRGAKPNVGDRLKKTPLHFGSEHGHIEVVRSLVSYDAAIDSQTTDRKTPLHFAAAGGHTEVVQFLLDKGATSNIRDRWQRVPLHYASEKGYTEIVESLLSHGAKANIKDRNKSTAIHLAAGGGHTEIIEALLAHSDKLNTVEDHDNWHSPLNWALLGGHTDSAKCLVSHGASIFGENEWGYSPILIATVLNNEEVMEYFVSSGVTNENAVQVVRQKYQLSPDWKASRHRHQIKYLNIKTGLESNSHPNMPKDDTK